MFTEKAKEKFEKWYPEYIQKIEGISVSKDTYNRTFWILPLSMQIGVVEDFAESEGYYIDFDVLDYRDDCGGICFDFNIIYGNKQQYCSNKSYATNKEVRNEAIKKLNELINENRV